MIWKTLAAAAGVTTVLAAMPQARDDYRAAVDLFADAPADAIERMLALPADEVARGVRDAAGGSGNWSADAIDRALLMHGDAAIALAKDHGPGAATQAALADTLALAAGRLHGNEWFAHRWYAAFTARVPAKVLEAHWHEQGWYKAGAAMDRGRQLEYDGGQILSRPDQTVLDPAPFRQAIPVFEQAMAGHVLAAAVHLGRIQMLRGNDVEARRLLTLAENDPMSRVNRYLASLFLGAMTERDVSDSVAEGHYRKALAALPRAQSGRLALAALLARTDRTDEARTAIVDPRTPAFYDPWWSYAFDTERTQPTILAELHSEVCR